MDHWGQQHEPWRNLFAFSRFLLTPFLSFMSSCFLSFFSSFSLLFLIVVLVRHVQKLLLLHSLSLAPRLPPHVLQHGQGCLLLPAARLRQRSLRLQERRDRSERSQREVLKADGGVEAERHHGTAVAGDIRRIRDRVHGTVRQLD